MTETCHKRTRDQNRTQTGWGGPLTQSLKGQPQNTARLAPSGCLDCLLGDDLPT